MHHLVLTDYLSTPWKVLSSTAGTRWSGAYYPFGLLRTESGSTRRGNLRFPGQYHDRESGLYYNVFRYYIPEDGRYANVDPVLDPAITPYSYAGERPAVLTDPLGLDICTSFLADMPILGCLIRVPCIKHYSALCEETAQEAMPSTGDVVDCSVGHPDAVYLQAMLECIDEHVGEDNYVYRTIDMCSAMSLSLAFPGKINALRDLYNLWR